MKHNTFYYLFKNIQETIDLAVFKSKWRQKNLHNLTVPMNIWPLDKVTVGKYTYGNLNCFFYGTNDNSEYIKIGNSCSIANDTVFLAGGEHKFDSLTTYPYMQKYIDKNHYAAFSKGPIIVEDDVWIGRKCMILSGVRIGKGAVIGASSVVTHDIPPYSVVAGVPASVIKYRFSAEIIDRLINLDYSAIDIYKIRDNIELFDNKLDIDNIEIVVKSVHELVI